MRLQLCFSCGAHWGVKKEVERDAKSIAHGRLELGLGSQLFFADRTQMTKGPSTRKERLSDWSTTSRTNQRVLRELSSVSRQT